MSVYVHVCVSKQPGDGIKHLFVFCPREARAQLKPTALAKPNKALHHLVPSFSGAAKLQSSNWTFNKTLSNLIRQTPHPPPAFFTLQSAQSGLAY